MGKRSSYTKMLAKRKALELNDIQIQNPVIEVKRLSKRRQRRQHIAANKGNGAKIYKVKVKLPKLDVKEPVKPKSVSKLIDKNNRGLYYALKKGGFDIDRYLQDCDPNMVLERMYANHQDVRSYFYSEPTEEDMFDFPSNMGYNEELDISLITHDINQARSELNYDVI